MKLSANSTSITNIETGKYAGTKRLWP